MLGYTFEQRPGSKLSAVGRPPRRRQPRHEPYADGGIEPTLDDLMSDPLTAAVMRRDGVSPETLKAVVMSARETLRSRSPVPE